MDDDVYVSDRAQADDPLPSSRTFRSAPAHKIRFPFGQPTLTYFLELDEDRSCMFLIELSPISDRHVLGIPRIMHRNLRDRIVSDSAKRRDANSAIRGGGTDTYTWQQTTTAAS